MLVTFKSRASGDVIMFGDVAGEMLRLMGKDQGKEGIITVEQMPDAIARLKQAIQNDKAQHAQAVKQTDDGSKHKGSNAAVSITQRAAPLIQLLEYSLKDDKPVMWSSR